MFFLGGENSTCMMHDDDVLFSVWLAEMIIRVYPKLVEPICVLSPMLKSSYMIILTYTLPGTD